MLLHVHQTLLQLKVSLMYHTPSYHNVSYTSEMSSLQLSVSLHLIFCIQCLLNSHLKFSFQLTKTQSASRWRTWCWRSWSSLTERGPGRGRQWESRPRTSDEYWLWLTNDLYMRCPFMYQHEVSLYVLYMRCPYVSYIRARYVSYMRRFYVYYIRVSLCILHEVSLGILHVGYL
jgi:hypothetical protein